MNKLFSIILITLTISSSPIYEVCTEDAKEMVDQVFNIIETFEENPLNPNADALKAIFFGLDKFMHECVHLDVDIKKYAKCVDGMMPMFPQVNKLIQDIKAGQTANLMIDITTLALTLVNGITSCVKQSNFFHDQRALF
jgi:hypothetical protein